MVTPAFKNNMDKMDANQLELLNWDYHNEGNANIVFKNLEYKLALRLRKVNKEFPTLKNTQKSDSKKISNPYSLEQEQKFKNEILSLYLKGDLNYFHESRLVFLSQNFIEKLLSLELELVRPESRRTKCVSLKPQMGLIMPFLGILSCPFKLPSKKNFVSVELKPKWGSLPVSENITAIKKSWCRFCLHQKMKTSKDAKKTTSKYCPLDLYGDCKCKVNYAITSLLETPQNNLKLNLNGSSIKKEDLFHMANFTKESFSAVVTEIIHNDSKHGNQQETLLKERDLKFCLNSNFHLHEMQCTKQGLGGVFNLLRNLQQFDRFDIENVYGEYLKTLKKFDYSLEEFLDFNSQLWNDLKTQGFVTKSSDRFDIFEICHFLVAATFKDCSVVITFCEVENQDSHSMSTIIKSFGRFFMYEIKLIDLDPRSVLNIPYYYNLDQRIVMSWKS